MSAIIQPSGGSGSGSSISNGGGVVSIDGSGAVHVTPASGQNTNIAGGTTAAAGTFTELSAPQLTGPWGSYISLNGDIYIRSWTSFGDRGGIILNGSNGGVPGVQLNGSVSIGPTGANDVIFFRDSAGILAQRDNANGQTFRVYNTYTDDSNYQRATLTTSSTAITLAAESAGTGAADIDVNLTPKGAGQVVVSSSLSAAGMTSSGRINANGDIALRGGNLQVQNGGVGKVVLWEGGSGELRTLGLGLQGYGAGGTISSPMRAPAQLTGDVNNWAPGPGRYIRADSTGSHSITGMVAGEDGQECFLFNAGDNIVIIAHQSIFSAEGNRFLCITGADITLHPDEGVWAFYDIIDGRWRIFPA